MAISLTYPTLMAAKTIIAIVPGAHKARAAQLTCKIEREETEPLVREPRGRAGGKNDSCRAVWIIFQTKVQAALGAGLTGFDFDRVDFPGPDGEEVHLGAAAPGFACPVKHFAFACGQHLLGDK